jgi:UDPglucose 6-dehydrogenase
MALKLSVIGTGYLGATHAACMASLGFEVIGFDIEASKIDLLSKGKVPFYEPELEELLSEQIKSGRLTFTSNIADLAEADVHFICVGTPQVKNGNAADLTYVNSALESIAKFVKPGGLVVGK